jgi:hypothetical protein
MTARVPWWDRLNNRLRPYIGPPPLGPYDQAPEVHVKPCPLCGAAMAGHGFEHRVGKPTLMHCPV